MTTRGKLSNRSWFQAPLAVAALGLLLGACGGGSKKSGSAAGTTSTTGVTEASSVSTTILPTQGDATATTVGAVTSTTRKASGVTATTVRSGLPKQGAQAVTRAPTAGIGNVSAAPTTAPNQNIQPGGTITYLKTADIAGLDPIILQHSGTSDGPPAFLVFDVLVYSDPADGQVKAQAAESLTSTDALVWTLKLHPNMKFSDGTAYDANAVKFNWQRLQDPNNHAPRATQANLIQSMDVVDPSTLRLTLKVKNAVFPQAVVLIPFIGSPTAILAKGANFTSDPVGAGPFLLRSWVRDSQMVFTRNPNYWDAPRPYVDQVIAKPIPDESQRDNTFLTGGANLTYVGVPANVDTVAKGGGVSYPQVLNGGIDIHFNVTKPPFNDLRARQAIALAIDRNDYSKVATGGVIEPMHSAFRRDSPYYDDGILQLAYDPTKAQQLLDQLAAETGGPLQFTLYSFNVNDYPIAATYVQGVLNKFRNIKVSVQLEASAIHIARDQARDYQAEVYGNVFDDPEPLWTSIFTCAASPSVTGWCDPKFDAAVADNQISLDPAKRIADIKEAQRIFYSGVPTLFIERRYTWLFTAPNVQDLKWVNDGMPMLNRMWIKTQG